jgi:hypothetical protein
MAETTLIKASLIELDESLTSAKPGAEAVPVQFNPDTMKVTFANQIAQPAGGDQAGGTAGRQFVGAGTTKLALTLWFDVTAMTKDAVDDVRRLTKKVIYFITPTSQGSGKSEKHIAPGVRFQWGSFIFDGMVEGLEETLEFFSPEGKPLRASISLNISQQKILVSDFKAMDKVPLRTGQKKFEDAKKGDSIQDMVKESGGSGGSSSGAGNNAGGGGGANGGNTGGGWQAVAAGNNIEDPLRLQAGAKIDLDLKANMGGGFGASGALSVAAQTGASLPIAITIQPPKPRLGLN